MLEQETTVKPLSCEHKRVMSVSAKANDLQFYKIPHLDIEHEGYAPYIDGVCCGDYIRFNLCLDCGKIIGFDGITDEELKSTLVEA